jgi:PAS domain S-box-containing protein
MIAPSRILTDANGRIVEASSGAATLLGINERWIVGKPLATFVAEPRRREFRTLLLGLAGGAAPAGLTLELRRRDGSEISAEVEASALGWSRDRLEWLLVDREPSDLEDGGQSRESRLGRVPLQRVLARFPHGIIGVDRELGVEYANPAARVYVGKEAGLRIGGSLPDPWPDVSLPQFAQALFGRRPPLAKLVETAAGRTLTLEGIPASKTDTAVLVLEDVTRRERRRRAESEFVSNAAHELQTPVAAIQSALEVLQAGAKDVASDRDLFLAHIERESERLARLARTLLQLARAETGEEPPTLILVELRPLLEEVAAELTPAPEVAVAVSCRPGVGVLADPDLVRQVVWNIASNAARHTSAGEVVLSGRDLGRVTEIEVADTGSGMTQVEQERAFDRFYRAGRRSDGFGLGLAIARDAVRALSGTITLDSTLDVGTRVRIQLPSARLVNS